MAERSTQLKIMGALLAGIGLFVTTTPSAPAPDTLEASAARASRVADSSKAAAEARARLARANARPGTSAAGTDALDGGSGPTSRTSARTTAAPGATKTTKPATVTGSSVRRATSTT